MAGQFLCIGIGLDRLLVSRSLVIFRAFLESGQTNVVLPIWHPHGDDVYHLLQRGHEEWGALVAAGCILCATPWGRSCTVWSVRFANGYAGCEFSRHDDTFRPCTCSAKHARVKSPGHQLDCSRVPGLVRRSDGWPASAVRKGCSS